MGPAGDRAVGRDVAPAVGGRVVEHEPAGRAAERDPHRHRVVGRDQLGDRRPVAVGFQLDPVVVRVCELAVVVERDRAGRRIGGRRSGGRLRHHLEHQPVSHPRTGLVADRECLQAWAVPVVVVVGPGVHPAQGAGVGDRGEEGEPVGPGGGREVVAAAEEPVGQGAAGGDHPVGGTGPDRVAGVAQADPVEKARHVLSRCRVPGQLDRDRTPTGERPEGDAAQVPLVRVHRLRQALGGGVRAVAQLVDHAVRGRPGAVLEDDVDGDVTPRVAQLVVQPVADHVRQLGGAADDQVDVVQEHAVHPVRGGAVEPHRVGADEPVPGDPVVPVGRAVGDPDRQGGSVVGVAQAQAAGRGVPLGEVHVLHPTVSSTFSLRGWRPQAAVTRSPTTRSPRRVPRRSSW